MKLLFTLTFAIVAALSAGCEVTRQFADHSTVGIKFSPSPEAQKEAVNRLSTRFEDGFRK